MAEGENLNVSAGQLRELARMTDGLWHQASTSVGAGLVIATVAAALWRQGMAERAEGSDKKYRYRITDKGRRALAIHGVHA